MINDYTEQDALREQELLRQERIKEREFLREEKNDYFDNNSCVNTAGKLAQSILKYIPTSDEYKVPCSGLSDYFHATNTKGVMQALRICETCEIKENCFEFAKETKATGVYGHAVFRNGYPMKNPASLARLYLRESVTLRRLGEERKDSFDD